jgi:aspartate aminotransferase
LTDSTAFVQRLLAETGVALAPGSAFGEGGEGHVRLCYASSSEIVHTAITRVAAHLTDK